MTLGPLFRDLEGAEAGVYAFGFGTGRYGQSTQILGEEVDVIDLRKAVGTGSTDDAGLYKILLDLGLIGLVIFLSFHLYVAYLGWPLRKNARENPLYRASAVAIVTWQILFLKSHTTLSDVMIHLFFWFYLGMLIASRSLLRSPETVRSATLVSRVSDATIPAT
jgi:O-antigen ligase